MGAAPRAAASFQRRALHGRGRDGTMKVVAVLDGPTIDEIERVADREGWNLTFRPSLVAERHLWLIQEVCLRGSSASRGEVPGAFREGFAGDGPLPGA